MRRERVKIKYRNNKNVAYEFYSYFVVSEPLFLCLVHTEIAIVFCQVNVFFANEGKTSENNAIFYGIIFIHIFDD